MNAGPEPSWATTHALADARPQEGRGASILDCVRAVLHPTHAAALDRPRVTITYAQSLDGCIAANLGCRTEISSRQSRVLTHHLREMHDAILVGINTVLVDDPMLNARLVSRRGPRPVIVDSTLKTPPEARVLCRRDTAPIVATSETASEKRAARLVEAGAEILRLRTNEQGRIDLTELCQRLGKRGIHSVMIEGGAQIITSALVEGLGDQLVLTISPQFLGGVRAIDAWVDLEDRARLENLHYELVTGDLVLHAEIARAD